MLFLLLTFTISLAGRVGSTTQPPRVGTDASIVTQNRNGRRNNDRRSSSDDGNRVNRARSWKSSDRNGRSNGRNSGYSHSSSSSEDRYVRHYYRDSSSSDDHVHQNMHVHIDSSSSDDDHRDEDCELLYDHHGVADHSGNHGGKHHGNRHGRRRGSRNHGNGNGHGHRHGKRPCYRFYTTPKPTAGPTKTPTTSPTIVPTASPTMTPTVMPSRSPSPGPTKGPTPNPTNLPTVVPTPSPTSLPTIVPTPSPTMVPTPLPTRLPTALPTRSPTKVPTPAPSPAPTPMPSNSPTKLPTAAPTPEPTAVPTAFPLGPVQPGQGCSNAATIVLPGGELPGVESAEMCKAECDAFGYQCHTAQFTTGWIAWGTETKTFGGYDNVISTSAMQTLIANKCKIASCGDCNTGQCNAAGTRGCPDDEACVSVGPSSLCGSYIPSHTAMECIGGDSYGVLGEYPGSITPGSPFQLECDEAQVEKVTGAKCGPSTPAEANQHANSCYGPYQDSDVFEALAGDVLSWEYRAEAQGDWFEVMVVILRDGIPVNIPTFRFGDAMSFRTDSWVVDQSSSSYVIRFIVGSYDASGLTQLGAFMEINKFERNDPNGNGYNMCRLLGDGCNQVPLEGGSISTRGTSSPPPMARRIGGSLVDRMAELQQ